MPKPDPSLLDPARYPGARSMMPRFADLDVNMHVNNVAMLTFMEDARYCFNRDHGFYDPPRTNKSMLVSLAVEYLGQAYVSDPVVVHSGYEHFGRSSFTMVQLVMQSGQPVAFSRAIIVNTDMDAVPSPLPAHFLARAEPCRLRA